MDQFTNTITKRIGVVILLAGLLTLSFGLYDMSRPYLSTARFFEQWLEVIAWDRYRIRQYPVVFYGSYIAILGLFLSVLYDAITGRFVQWIMTGRAKRND